MLWRRVTFAKLVQLAGRRRRCVLDVCCATGSSTAVLGVRQVGGRIEPTAARCPRRVCPASAQIRCYRAHGASSRAPLISRSQFFGSAVQRPQSLSTSSRTRAPVGILTDGAVGRASMVRTGKLSTPCRFRHRAELLPGTARKPNSPLTARLRDVRFSGVLCRWRGGAAVPRASPDSPPARRERIADEIDSVPA